MTLIWRQDTQYNDNQHNRILYNDTRHYKSVIMPSKIMLSVIHAECHYAECHSCLVSITLDVANKPIVLSVIILNAECFGAVVQFGE